MQENLSLGNFPSEIIKNFNEEEQQILLTRLEKAKHLDIKSFQDLMAYNDVLYTCKDNHINQFITSIKMERLALVKIFITKITKGELKKFANMSKRCSNKEIPDFLERAVKLVEKVSDYELCKEDKNKEKFKIDKDLVNPISSLLLSYCLPIRTANTESNREKQANTLLELVSTGLDINAIKNDEPVMHQFADSSDMHVEFISLILTLGFNPNLKDKNGNTFLMRLCTGKAKTIIFEEACKIIPIENVDALVQLAEKNRVSRKTIRRIKGLPEEKEDEYDVRRRLIGNQTMDFEERMRTDPMFAAFVRHQMEKMQSDPMFAAIASSYIERELLKMYMKNSDGESDTMQSHHLMMMHKQMMLDKINRKSRLRSSPPEMREKKHELDGKKNYMRYSLNEFKKKADEYDAKKEIDETEPGMNLMDKSEYYEPGMQISPTGVEAKELLYKHYRDNEEAEKMVRLQEELRAISSTDDLIPKKAPTNEEINEIHSLFGIMNKLNELD